MAPATVLLIKEVPGPSDYCALRDQPDVDSVSLIYIWLFKLTCLMQSLWTKLSCSMHGADYKTQHSLSRARLCLSVGYFGCRCLLVHGDPASERRNINPALSSTWWQNYSRVYQSSINSSDDSHQLTSKASCKQTFSKTSDCYHEDVSSKTRAHLSFITVL